MLFFGWFVGLSVAMSHVDQVQDLFSTSSFQGFGYSFSHAAVPVLFTATGNQTLDDMAPLKENNNLMPLKGGFFVDFADASTCLEASIN